MAERPHDRGGSGLPAAAGASPASAGARPAPERAVITVDGIDGSGKSTLARRLAAALGPAALLLGVDEFRDAVDWNRRDRSELDLYYDERYELAALDATLRAFRAGAPAGQAPRFDPAGEARVGVRPVELAGRRWAVVEGVFVARLATVRPDLAIFVDVPRAVAEARVLARDVAAGRPRAEVERRLRVRYWPAHDRYLAERDPRGRADLVLDNQDPAGPRLLRGQLPGGPGWEPVCAALSALLRP